MKTKIDGLPNWSLQINEVSAGVYNLVAEYPLGYRIDLTGVEIEELPKQTKTSAAAIEGDLQEGDVS